MTSLPSTDEVICDWYFVVALLNSKILAATY